MTLIKSYFTIKTTIFGGVKEAFSETFCIIGAELDNYVVLKIISPIRYNHHVIHYTHGSFTLISDHVAK